jgi:lysozyme
MKKPGLEQIKGAMSRLKYVIFDGIDEQGVKKNFDLNIFGVRSANAQADRFDDWIGIFWIDWEKNGWEYYVWEATTDPGLYYLYHPLQVEGTAILKEGQHRSSHTIGLHRGKYQALVQHSILPVYRDKDRDSVLDVDPASLQNGQFGINIHRTAAYVPLVGNKSAGCQVIADPANFATLMDICLEAKEFWGPVFTYTLLTEEQLGDVIGRTINDEGLKLVKSFEGCELKSYRCPAGVWTIGYGHTKNVSPNQTITQEQAEQLLHADMEECVSYIDELVQVPLTDNQFSALVSFVFNVGKGNLMSSTLLKKLNAGEYDAVPNELARWNKATDPNTGVLKVLPGLVTRRAAEAKLWLTKSDPQAFENSKGMPQLVMVSE